MPYLETPNQKLRLQSFAISRRNFEFIGEKLRHDRGFDDYNFFLIVKKALAASRSPLTLNCGLH
jgi:hypothetical protein